MRTRDLVAVAPPEPLDRFVTARGYVGPGVPLLKRVLGLPGQRVCRAGRAIAVEPYIPTVVIGAGALVAGTASQVFVDCHTFPLASSGRAHDRSLNE